MESLQKEGLCKSIGVSNFREEDLLEIKDHWTIPPAVNQVCRSGPFFGRSSMLLA